MSTAPAAYENPGWGPLKRAVKAAGLELQVCSNWMWMGHGKYGTESYKHRDSRHYIWVNQDGDVYHGTGMAIAPEDRRKMLLYGEVAE